jgi:hypothetical protein
VPLKIFTMIINNAFTDTEIKKIQKCCDYLPVDKIEKNNTINKNLSYNVDLSPLRSIIKPKINKYIGEDHIVATSSYKECFQPYPLHFDTYSNHKELEIYDFSSGIQKYNVAVLIPLVEGIQFKTAVFNINYNKQNINNDYLNEEWLVSNNDLNVCDYDHLSNNILCNLNKLPLIEELPWNLGSIITWDRNKLHCSSNFEKFNVVKKMIVLFIE